MYFSAALIGTNAAARSRIACELEKQAIILALEEGKEALVSCLLVMRTVLCAAKFRTSCC